MQTNQPNGYYPQYQLPSARVSFCSQKHDIRKADDICRLVLRELPVYSNTRLERANCSAKYRNVLFTLYRYSESLVSEIRGFCSQAKSPIDFYLRKLSAVKSTKVGNCQELADITAMAFRMNGAKNADVYSLKAYNPVTNTVRNIDHVVVGVNITRPLPKPSNSRRDFYGLDRGAIIVDPWAGFTCSERDASVSYKRDKSLGFGIKPEEIVIYTQNKDIDMRDMFSKKDILYFRHMFPELSKKKKFNLWEKIVWHFMDKSKYEYEKFPISLKETAKRNCNLKSALSTEEFHELLNGPRNK
ncbi:MAG: hypothetical protein K6E29_01895 [Cyanobacteria bacterium RUI128]|nr:hypothetical protein [Cyanobacteria bacterium RUI128]